MSVILDTSFLLALVFPRDINHRRATRARQQIRVTRVLPAPVLPELFYMVSDRMHYARAIQTYELVHSAGFQIETLQPADRTRRLAIMRQYRDAAFAYTDVAIMALAERLNIRQIYAFDRRDFSMFRPTHADFLDLLP